MHARTLRWDGCCNIRDLGGHPTEDGGETRFGEVVRADNIRQLSEEGWRQLVEYGVRRIVDLRFDSELDEDRPRDLPVDVVHVPLLEPAGLDDIDALVADITEASAWRRVTYLAFLERFSPNFARAVTEVARAPRGAVVVHCQGGVDRTGLVAALLLRVAGVGVDAVAADYAESEANWAPFIDGWLETAEDDQERERRRMLSLMPAAAMCDVLTEVERRHGSAWGYLVDAGADEQDLRLVKARLRG